VVVYGRGRGDFICVHAAGQTFLLHSGIFCKETRLSVIKSLAFTAMIDDNGEKDTPFI
jgi:hypothetical protein